MRATQPSPATRPQKRRRRSPGWVPDQHGAWAMLAVPLLVGVVLGGPTRTHLILALTWFAGYFAFFAAGLWFKSRFKSKYLPPVRAYALIAGSLGVLLLVSAPHLMWWAPIFAPLLTVSLWLSYRRKERGLLNDVVTVVAACLMVAVAASAGSEAALGPLVWCAALVLFAYFVGTVLYVKTMIRERGSRAYLLASVGYHLATSLLPFALYLTVPAWRVQVAALGSAMLTAFFGALAVRAVWVPRTSATPRQVGVSEIVVSTVLTVALLVFL